jgi:hypothetical protein
MYHYLIYIFVNLLQVMLCTEPQTDELPNQETF